MMIKLFVDAALDHSESGSYIEYGDALSNTFGPSYQYEVAGCTPSSEWTAEISMSERMCNKTVELIANLSDEAADIFRKARSEAKHHSD